MFGLTPYTQSSENTSVPLTGSNSPQSIKFNFEAAYCPWSLCVRHVRSPSVSQIIPRFHTMTWFMLTDLSVWTSRFPSADSSTYYCTVCVRVWIPLGCDWLNDFLKGRRATISFWHPITARSHGALADPLWYGPCTCPSPVSQVPIIIINTPPPNPPRPQHHTSVSSELSSEWKILRRWKFLLALLMLLVQGRHDSKN